MKKIAFEEHLGTPELMALRGRMLEKLGLKMTLPPEVLKRTGFLACDVEAERLPGMDKNGIAVQVLQPGSNGLEGVDDEAEAARICTEFNNHMAGVVKKWPGRFVGFAALPQQFPQLAAAELRRCMALPGMKGAVIVGRNVIGGRFFDETPMWPVWQAAQDTGALLYLHPSETHADQTVSYQGIDALLGPTWSWGVDTATYMMRFILGGLFDRFPGVRIIMGHLGEMLPYALWRIDNRWRIAPMDAKNQKPPSSYFKSNIYASISGNYSQAALRCAIEAVGADRLVFAVDYPFESNEEASGFIESAGIDEADRRKICYENGQAMLGIG